jgi:hypothetical protein
MAGLAGGVALTRKRKSRGPLSRIPTPKLNKPSLSLPQVNVPKPQTVVKSVGKAAGEVAKRSEQVNRVASDVQKASDAIDGSMN